MAGKCKVTYLSHSGFLVETEHNYLLFDFWKGDIPELSYEKTLYVFSSHSHHDHYSKAIFKLENQCKEVRYILSSDIKEVDHTWRKSENVTFVDAYEKLQVGDCMIETLRSTDLGVAFLLQIEGLSIYHAGDLHRWEWPGEDPEENAAAVRNYEEEIERIAGRKIDLAFVVLDPRQEEVGGKGMDLFLSKVGAKYVFPMHVWDDYAFLADYRQKNQRRYLTSEIMNITKPGDRFSIEIG